MKYNIHNQVEDFFAEQERLNQIDRGEKNLDLDTRNNKQYKQYKQDKQIYNKDNYADKKLSLNDQAPPVVGSLRESNVFAACPQGNDPKDLPKKWRTVKIDLFNNTKDIQHKPYDYHMKLNVYLYEKCEENNYNEMTPIRYGCKFNDTSLDSFNIKIIKSDPHYKYARKIRDEIYVDAQELGIEHMSLNKFYMPAKHTNARAKFTPGFSGLLLRTRDSHWIKLFCGLKQYDFELSNTNLTIKQKQANIIGSCTRRAEDRLEQNPRPATEYLF
jgi:hypothetical protein